MTGAGVSGQIVYAIGDIHGCYSQLRTLLDQISADIIARAGGRCPVLVFLGDYVDRGPASAKVLDALAWLGRHKPVVVHFLRGNHEQMMLDWIADPVAVKAWLGFGGADTLRSYGIDAPQEDDAARYHLRARDDLLDQMPAAHLNLLRSLETMLAIGDYLFVHAGIRPGIALGEQKPADLLWIREPFMSSTVDHGKVVVHGHSWLDERPQIHPNRICIDTGTYSNGVLTAIRLEDGNREFLQTEPDPRPGGD